MLKSPTKLLKRTKSSSEKELKDHTKGLETDYARERLITESENLLPSSQQAVPEKPQSMHHHHPNYEVDDGIQKELDTFFTSDDSGGTLEDGRHSKLQFSKLTLQEGGLLFFSISGIVLCVVSYDLEFKEATRYSLECSVALWVNFASSLVLIYLTIMRYMQAITFQKARLLLSPDSGIISSGQWTSVIAEIVLILLQPYPFLRGCQFSIENILSGKKIFYNVNDIFYILIIFRINLPLRVILSQTQYYSPRAQRICDMYGAEKGYLFAVKCLMKEVPTKVITMTLVATLFILAYALRICERPFFVVDKTVDLANYLNCVWMVILTITTLGYGDYYPRTLAGRGVLFVGCIWGVFILSLMVISVTTILNLSSAENKALIILERLEKRRQRKEKAAYVLSNMARIGVAMRQKRKGAKQIYNIDKAIVNVQKYANEFKQIDRQLRALDDGDINEEMSRHFEFIRDEMKELTIMQEALKEKIQKLSTRLLTDSDNANAAD